MMRAQGQQGEPDPGHFERFCVDRGSSRDAFQLPGRRGASAARRAAVPRPGLPPVWVLLVRALRAWVVEASVLRSCLSAWPPWVLTHGDAIAGNQRRTGPV